MDTKAIIDKKLVYWEKKLIDLSKRNNLVSYRFTKSKSLKIAIPSFENVIQDLDNELNILFLKEEKESPKERRWLCSEEEEVVDKKLYRLYLQAKNNFQELGVNTCFVSLGMLKYKDSNSTEIVIQAPVFLYPVEIARLSSVSKETHRFEIESGSGDLQLNHALKEKLVHDFGLDIEDMNNRTPKEYLDYLMRAVEGMNDWDVVEEVFLDIFSYQKYIMFKDLEDHRELVEKSPLVRAYVGDRDALQDEISETRREEFDDATSADVLPADSTQKRAVELAKSGVTYVLQGPPGTGKSQTIVNIIAALIQEKKKILFVSQKMAALNVVQKRLDEIGLGRYCLNLHTYKGNKREIVKQLMTELLTSPKINDSVKRFGFENYLDVQKEINEFYKFLCEKHYPWNLSVYDIRGELSKFYDVEIIDLSLIKTLELDHKEFSLLQGKLERMQSIFSKVRNPTSNVLFGF